jgi:WD40 repeat protein
MATAAAGLAWATYLAACVGLSVPPQGPTSAVPIKLDPRVPPATDQYGDPLPTGALARVGTSRLRHVTTWSLAFSAHGELLASAGTGSVRVWHLPEGKLVYQSAQPSPCCVAFSPSGRILAAGDWNGDVIWWDLQSKKELHKIAGQKRRINALAFSPDGELIAIGSDRSGCVWDLRSRTEMWRFVPEKAGVDGAAFSRDGKTLAMGSEDGTIRLWASATGKELRRLAKQSGGLNSLAFSPDGNTLVSAGPSCGGQAGEVNTWDVESGKRLSNFKAIGHWHTATLSTDGKLVAVDRAGAAGVDILATDTGIEVSMASTNPSLATVIAFSPNSKLLATTGPGSALQLWDAATMKPAHQIGGHQQGITALAFAGQGRYLATANREGAFLWDAEAGKQLAALDGKLRYDPVLAASADGKLLAVGSEETSLWNLENRRLLRRLPVNLLSRPSLSFSEDSRLLFAPGSSGSLTAWHAGSGKKTLTFEATDDALDGFLAYAIASSPGGKVLVAAGFDSSNGQVSCVQWQQAAPKEPALFRRQPEGRAYHLALSPDGQFLAYDDHDGGVIICQVSTGRHLLYFAATKKKSQERGVWCLAFSPDGKTLVTGNLDRSIRLWEATTGRQRHHFVGHQDTLRQLAFAPDGKRLASAADDTTVLVWDLSSAGRGHGDPKDLPRLWADLAEADAAKAYHSMWAMALLPKESIAFLRRQLRPVTPADSKLTARLIVELGSKDFAVRDRATRQLTDLSEPAGDALRKALAGNPTLEVRRRLEKLLESLETASMSADQLRLLRALEALEFVGTEEARAVLEPLARGVAEARLTREARAALVRFNKRAEVSRKP